MKSVKLPTGRIIAAIILIVSAAYGIFYFNYFETPTGDYISNIRGPVLEYLKGNFPGDNYKFLPLYPLLLTFLTGLNPAAGPDPIYQTAIILNMILLAPYLFLVFLLYRKFLPEKTSWAAILFLGINVYTIYMAINSELEMTLTILTVLSLYLTLRDSKAAYAGAFLGAFTKWDAVFIIPAVMFRDFFHRNKRILAVILGACASAGTAAWIILSFISSRTHPYVSEIAHRGPNIYRFIIDCFLVAGGFTQWMATHAWFHENLSIKIGLLAFLLIPGIITLAGTVWGGILIWKRQRREFAPIFIFSGGFLLIHIIYQNTKDRYVMPILWLLTLFLFYGITEGMWPWIRERFTALSPKSQKALRGVLAVAAGAAWVISFAAIVRDHTLVHCIFAILFACLMAAIVLHGTGTKSILNSALLILAGGVLINLMVFYTVRAMDHHGLSRVEFKKVALWYKDNATPSDRMVISETNVPKYYSGFGDEKFILSYFVQGKTVEELVPEFKAYKVTYVFVDDFYIRRLKYMDPNAIDRKAWIFREIRDHGQSTGHFKLIKTFHTRGGITSYLYRFIP